MAESIRADVRQRVAAAGIEADKAAGDTPPLASVPASTDEIHGDAGSAPTSAVAEVQNATEHTASGAQAPCSLAAVFDKWVVLPRRDAGAESSPMPPSAEAPLPFVAQVFECGANRV
ncbi:MAG TPA: hypothetical protein EYN26_06405 [Chromatiales bacterium]|nr:hypothetical protein [Chromatiales bacterium]